MKFLSERFTRLTNLRVCRDGPLFRGRYTSVPISSDAQLVQTCRYIHLNPVVARLTPTAESWRWSSAAAYLGRGDRRPWLKTDAILELFGPGDALAAYRGFVAAGDDPGTRDFYADMRW